MPHTEPNQASRACPSEHRLDQRALGELPMHLVDELEAHLQTCPHCIARLAERAEQQQDFVVNLSLLASLKKSTTTTTEPVTTPTMERSPAPVVWWRRPPTWIGAVAAAAAMALVVVRTPPPDTTTKGARTTLFAQAPGTTARLLKNGDTIHPRDVLQVAVTSAVDVDVAVVSRDGAGATSVYVSFVRVAAGARVPLPTATLLDDVVGAEHIAVVLCPTGRSMVDTDVTGAVDHDVGGCDVERHTLNKVER